MGWKDFSELAPQLTAAEAAFEKKKRMVGLYLGPLVFLVIFFLPPLPHVNALGMRSLAILSWAVIWWVTEAIPIPATSFMVLPLIVLCGLFPYERAFGYWAHWTNLFLIGAFILGQTMETYGLTRRISLSLVCSRWVGGNAWRLLILFLLSNVITGAFTTNTVDAILYMSIGLGLLKTLNIAPGSGFGTAMLLGIAWATNVGGKLTPSGSVPNMVAIGLAASAGYRIGYAQWFLANVVFTTLQTCAMFFVLRTFLSREERQMKVSTSALRAQLEKLGPMSRGEKVSCWVLGTVMLLWILPDIVPSILGRSHPVSAWLTTHMNWGVVALLAACSLFVIPLDWKQRKFAMTWGLAAQSIEIGTLALVAASLAMGDLVASKEVGLGELFNAGVASISGSNVPHWILIVGVIVGTVVISQITSGLALVSSLGAVILVVAPTLGLNPIALLVTISLAGNMAYTLPTSNPPNAIVFSSGYIRIVPMFMRGWILALIGIVLLSLTGYQMANWVLPWIPPASLQTP